MIMATESAEVLLCQQGRDDRGWLILCVPPGPRVEISVTVVACESPLRRKKISMVRQPSALLKVYVNPKVEEMDDWELEGVRFPVGTPQRLLPTSEDQRGKRSRQTEPRDARWRVAWMASGHLSDH